MLEKMSGKGFVVVVALPLVVLLVLGVLLSVF